MCVASEQFLSQLVNHTLTRVQILADERAVAAESELAASPGWASLSGP